jgi:aldehyde:ferredoxin oxidoreductase
VFNPESATRTETDIYINPASQEIYADFYNGMLGTELTWEEIFTQTDRDINLQRILNVLRYKESTTAHDWIPDRAIGPTDDRLYDAEADYNDGEVSRVLGRTDSEIAAMTTSEKRVILMDFRKQELRRLIQVYYAERGWNENGIPFIDTLEEIGLWPFLSDEAKAVLTELSS